MFISINTSYDLSILRGYTLTKAFVRRLTGNRWPTLLPCLNLFVTSSLVILTFVSRIGGLSVLNLSIQITGESAPCFTLGRPVEHVAIYFLSRPLTRADVSVPCMYAFDLLLLHRLLYFDSICQVSYHGLWWLRCCYFHKYIPSRKHLFIFWQAISCLHFSVSKSPSDVFAGNIDLRVTHRCGLSVSNLSIQITSESAPCFALGRPILNTLWFTSRVDLSRGLASLYLACMPSIYFRYINYYTLIVFVRWVIMDYID